MIDFLFNTQTCKDLIAQAPVNLILYTHIPSASVALLIGILVLGKNRSLLGRILFAISAFFASWVIFSLITWLSTNNVLTMIVWSFFGLITALIAILAFYFFYVFLFKKDLSLFKKILIFVPLFPIIILTPTIWNLAGFDLTNCEAIENSKFGTYYYIIGGLSVIGILLLGIWGWKKVEPLFKKQLILMLVGLEIFLIAFLSLSYIASYFDNYSIEFYGLIGMVVFMAFLAYMIVKFKEFNIKLIGAQALVWSLIILIGSLFVYMNQVPLSMLVIISITLIISAIVGLMIVRGVKKEISLRESLQIANKGQENLIHIMNHQVKGFFGIAKNIFAELLQTDDYGKMPEESKPLLEKGLESTSTGVDYVQEILRGFNAEKGLLTFEKKPVDIKEIVLKLLSEQKDIAVKKGLKFESNIDEGEYSINGDGPQLREAFKNLITNGIKYNDYTYSDRGIKINLSSKDNKIIFTVRDTGIGISEEDKANLFKAGGMGKNSLKYNSDSSGFGLSTVKGITEAHGGKVSYTPNKPEKGTTFFIELPIR